MWRSRDFYFLTLSFIFLVTHTYTCLQRTCKIYETLINENYGKSLLLCVNECKSLRLIYSISLAFHSACFE